MRSPDEVLKELAELYDFYKEIARFKFKANKKQGRDTQPAGKHRRR